VQHEGERARGRELGQLKDENKVTKAKEDRLMKEVGKLKEEILRVAAQHDSLVKDLAEATDLLDQLGQFPPSVKKGK
jgi:predicted  nucleic acid-binding Zn-ribbon protein